MSSNVEFDRKNISISPAYLMAISNNIDALNHFYEQQNLGTLSGQYKNTLTTSFKNLGQNLQIYSLSKVDNKTMIQSSVIRCKSELQIFCLQKMSQLLGRQSEELGKILKQAANFYRQNVDDYEKILLNERRRRLQEVETQKDRAIQKLKNDLIFKKQYIEQLSQRIKELENENSSMYQKLINTAKNTVQQTLSTSPRKNQQTLNPTISKIRQQIVQGSAHKTLSGKQVQETILDIMQTKLKQQNVKGKHVDINTFMKTYFRYKFGMKELAQETQANFREALVFFGQSSQKNVYILFRRILEEECEEHYFWEQKNFYEKMTKIVKRYLNQKENMGIDELQKIYDTKLIDQRLDVSLNEKDVEYILINAYKTSEVDSLQMIFNQILLPKLQQHNTDSQQLLIPSKKLINQILNYELQRHLFKIEDIIRVFREIEIGRGYINFEDLQTAIIRLKVPEQKITNNLTYLKSLQDRFLTISEGIEAVERVRKSKMRKRI